MDWASQVVLVVKNTCANAGGIRDMSSVPGVGRSPGGRHGNRLEYSCLENPIDRGAWRATDHRIQSWTRLKRQHAHMQTNTSPNLLLTINKYYVILMSNTHDH